MSLGGREEPTMQVVVYGPDGRAYGTPAAARAAGVTNYTMSPPAGFPISYPGRQPYTPAPMPSIPTQSYGGRNRYAEIMSQFGQSQPFSFFGMPSGGFNPYAPNYTGGFTPYQRPIPAPALPVEGTTSATAGGGGGGGGGRGLQEGPSAWSQMTPAERAAYYAANPIEGKIALGMQDYFTTNPLVFLSKLINPDAYYDSRLEKLGLDPESFAYGPPDPNFSSQAAAAARQEAQIAAVNAANIEGAGLLANPMAQDPAQRAVAADAAETQSLLSRYPALVEAPVPVVTAPPVEALPPGVMLPNLPAETQSLLSRYPAPAPTPAPAPVQTITAREIYRGDLGDPGPGYMSRSLGRGEREYYREVAVPVDRFTDSEGNFDFSALARAGLSIPGIGGGQGSSGGGYTVGGYAPGSQAAAAAASGQFGMGPGTPGFNSGGDGFAQGGHVSMQRLQGPNPEGPDDGYAALKDGEYVINDKAVKKYGIELMNLINSGKISKGKLRGLLEM